MTDMQITATLADHLPPAERPRLLRRLLASFLGRIALMSLLSRASTGSSFGRFFACSIGRLRRTVCSRQRRSRPPSSFTPISC